MFSEGLDFTFETFMYIYLISLEEDKQAGTVLKFSDKYTILPFRDILLILMGGGGNFFHNPPPKI